LRGTFQPVELLKASDRFGSRTGVYDRTSTDRPRPLLRAPPPRGKGTGFYLEGRPTYAPAVPIGRSVASA